MKITIHQPEHLPWLGFFHKISQADLFVVLDNVQFRKNYFQNRNKIRTIDGWVWITVPVNRTLETMIKDVTIAQNPRWREKWWNSLCCAYRRARYFAEYADALQKVIHSDTDNLCELNISFIELVCRLLEIKAKMIRASQLGVEGKGSDMILNICKKLDAEVYVSGISGREYLATDSFDKEDIKVVFQEFRHPIYEQLYKPFFPCMSIVDLLFNHGAMSSDIIQGKGVPVMEDLFL